MTNASFIELDGVSGESTNAAHKGSIDVISWSWGVSNTLPPAAGGAGVGKAVPAPLVFQHRYDKASPLLGRLCASGKHVKQAKLTVHTVAASHADFLVITLKEVLVTHLQVAMADDGHPVESVSLAYTDIECAYRPQTAAGGLGSAVKFGWNTRDGKVR